MTVAVSGRPVQQFETQVPIPDWQLTPEEQVFGDAPLTSGMPGPMVDENGMPFPTPGDGGMPQQQPMVRPDGTGEPSQQWLDQVLPPPQQQQQQQQQQPQQQQPQLGDPRSDPPPDPSDPRSDPS
jgi:penicillin-binding protein 1A